MKRLLKKSEKVYETNSNKESAEEVNQHEEVQYFDEQGNKTIEPYTDIPREDPYLGRYVEIANRRSKYYGYHARVDDKFYSDRYKIYIEPRRYDDDGDKGYIVNFVGVDMAPKWFTVIE